MIVLLLMTDSDFSPAWTETQRFGGGLEDLFAGSFGVFFLRFAVVPGVTSSATVDEAVAPLASVASNVKLSGPS